MPLDLQVRPAALRLCPRPSGCTPACSATADGAAQRFSHRASNGRGTLTRVRSEGYRVAVVGATGQVGSLMLRLLRERRFPARETVPFASERSAGRELDGGLIVLPLTDETIEGFDLALFSAGGSTSGEWAPRFAERGAVAIDKSSYWRMDPEVPLVVPEINPDATEQALAAGGKGIIASPNCSTYS